MYYICNMEMKQNNFDLEKRIEQYKIRQAQLMYDFASELLDQVADEDVLKLYKDNSDIFSKLSTLSKEDILKNKPLMTDAINVLIDYLKNKPLTKEEYENMTFEEIFNYITNLLDNKQLDLFDYIKYLESK